MSRDLFDLPPSQPTSYYVDTVDGRVYHAIVMLNDVLKPDEPPKVVSLQWLLSEERFIQVKERRK